MRPKVVRGWFAVAFSAAMGCSGATGAARAGTAVPDASTMRSSRATRLVEESLPNGMRVIVRETHGAPVVALQVWMGVGSADEREGEAGLAHVYEHMLFKGTERRPAGAIAREIESAGGEINAWTAHDNTVYHLVVASRFFDRGLDVLADALENTRFDPEELARELRVIQEEIRQGRDAPGRVASDILFATAFGAHPYGRPVIGTPESVASFTADKVERFFRRWYVPGSATLVVVGDVDADAAREKIRRAFGRWRGGDPPQRRRAPEPAQRALRTVVEAQPFREAQIAIGFHTPALAGEEAPALDLAAIVLGQGPSSRLVLRVKRERGLVNEVRAYAYTPRDPGLLVVRAACPPDKVADAVSAILAEIARLGREPVIAEELDRARVAFESDEVYQRETVQGTARKLGFYGAVAGDLAFEQRYREAARHVTAEALRAAAARFLAPANATVVAVVPSEATETLPSRAGEDGHRAVDTDAVAQLLRERAEAAPWLGRAEARRAAPPPAGEVDDATRLGIVRATLPNGLRVLVKRDADVPMLAMRAAWAGGLRYEGETTNGINALIGGLLTRGTRTRSAEDVAREIDAMAGSMSGVSGRNSLGLRGEFLSRHFDRALALFADVLLHPAFGDEEVERERRILLEEIRSRDDSPAQIAFLGLARALYRDHPYRMDPLGTPDTVGGFSAERLRDYFARAYPPGRLVLAIVGDVDPAYAIGRVRDLFAGDGGTRPESEPPAVPGVVPLTEPAQVFRPLAKQQAQVVLGYHGTTVRGDDRWALEVLATVLSAQGGRLFADLREDRGLAYRVSAVTVEGLEPGYIALYAATGPENVDTVVHMLLEEARRLRESAITAAELDRARRYLQGTHDISLQRMANRAALLALGELYGTGLEDWARYAERIGAVTAADVQRVARTYLRPDAYVLSIVRPATAAQTAAPAVQRR